MCGVCVVGGVDECVCVWWVVDECVWWVVDECVVGGVDECVCVVGGG